MADEEAAAAPAEAPQEEKKEPEAPPAEEAPAAAQEGGEEGPAAEGEKPAAAQDGVQEGAAAEEPPSENAAKVAPKAEATPVSSKVAPKAEATPVSSPAPKKAGGAVSKEVTVDALGGMFKSQFKVINSKATPEDKANAMAKIRNLLEGGACKAEGFKGLIRPGIQPLLDQLSNSRLALVTEACQTISTLARCAGEGSDIDNLFVDYIIPALMKHCYSNTKIVAQSTMEAIAAILTYVMPTRALPRLIDGAANKNSKLKLASLELILLTLQKWSVEKFGRYSTAVGDIIGEEVQGAGSQAVRKVARKCMSEYRKKFPEHSTRVLQDMDEHSLKQLGEIIPGAPALGRQAQATKTSTNASPPRASRRPAPKAKVDIPAGPVDDQVKSLMLSVEEERDQKGALEARISKLDSLLKAEKRKSKSLSSKVSALETKLAEADHKIEDQQREVVQAQKTAKEGAAALKKVSSLSARVTQLQEQLSQAEIALAEKDREAVHAKKDASDARNVAGEKVTLTKDVEHWRSRYDEITMEFEAAKGRWDARQQEWFKSRAELERNITDLEKEREKAAVAAIPSVQPSPIAAAEQDPPSQLVQTPPGEGGVKKAWPPAEEGEGADQLAMWGVELAGGAIPGAADAPAVAPRPPVSHQEGPQTPKAQQIAGEPLLIAPEQASSEGHLQRQMAVVCAEREEARVQAAMAAEEAAELQRKLATAESDRARLEAGLEKIKIDSDWRMRVQGQEMQRMRWFLQETDTARRRAEGLASALLVDVRSGHKDTQIARDHAEGLLARLESLLQEEGSRMKDLSDVKETVVRLCKGADKRLDSFARAEKREFEAPMLPPVEQQMRLPGINAGGIHGQMQQPVQDISPPKKDISAAPQVKRPRRKKV